MRKVVKLVFGLVFSLGLALTAKSQDSSANMPSEDDAIVCVQVSEDMFDCYVMSDSAAMENPGNEQNPMDQGGVKKDDEWNRKNNGKDNQIEWDQSDKNKGKDSQDVPSGSKKNQDKGSEVKDRRGKNGELYYQEEENPEIQALKE